ncbi:MAG TPA: bifunctional demethylmenaquinone methyltransferase/2-methoxy-6-polyprenyl-1,4-benzoquinol methylase UbiE [Candidatus Hydrogenedentes bacterium]|nr:bifunctional demethylmenaquinone methyltransferase/2-methoxy-6-polyprenyl-1,4-benzoquinol methylase UbiE [Candidatus Hydrogenedentota bacterium]HOL76510.1 bifunctional demethylmenaquinone methyltransferase/2-methoxy-6-polyprenyl-1,4-benzoquinol methylase UbiE [Candidatus Hydrogenedentota bacterium]HPO85175.1 bifunctional demethylmenaquinone methyltransferase/2-methoxy-6-polyprenyl-1,4-benzoquinol methylase UbiE [Candidatus Hydrogenedentota bacterium]
MEHVGAIVQFFESVAQRYDRLNRFLSFFSDIGWRKRLIQTLPKDHHLQLLDLATGTGEVLLSATKVKGLIGKSIGVDISPAMLSQASQKTRELKDPHIGFACADGLNLAFADQSFDAVTIAFGIRNMPDTKKALDEVYRVLRPGGHLAILEFSLPECAYVRCLYFVYLRYAVPFLGGVFTGNWKAYRYLQQSIERFPYGNAFCQILEESGFRNITAKSVDCGIVTIYTASK